MEHAVRLLVITARGESAERARANGRLVGHVTSAVIGKSPVPVLLLPTAYEEALPWRTAIVPVSGEPVAGDALATAVRLAAEIDLDLHAVHVTGSGSGESGIDAMARYTDAVHHEYPRQFEELVAGAFAGCTGDLCRPVKDVTLVRGDVATELIRLAGASRASLIVAGWHGQFGGGRSEVLKQLLQAVSCPVLLVKRAGRMPFRLKVEEAFQ
jgi:nucleotide-binding universal stress UspA family protein